MDGTSGHTVTLHTGQRTYRSTQATCLSVPVLMISIFLDIFIKASKVTLADAVMLDVCPRLLASSHKKCIKNLNFMRGKTDCMCIGRVTVSF